MSKKKKKKGLNPAVRIMILTQEEKCTKRLDFETNINPL